MCNHKLSPYILLLIFCHTYVDAAAEGVEIGTHMTKWIPQSMSRSFPNIGRSLLKFGRSLSKEYDSSALPCHDEGFYSHPSDCNKFYRCIEDFGTNDYVPLTFTCAPGTIFSKDLGSCVSGSCTLDGIPKVTASKSISPTDFYRKQDLSLTLRNIDANEFLPNSDVRLRSSIIIDQKLQNMCEGKENRFFCLDCKTLVLCMERLPQIIPCGYGKTCHDDTTSFRGGVCHPEAPVECTCNNEDIFRPDKYDPSKFLTCGAKGAEPVSQSCPEGLEFDEEFSLCGKPMETTCSKSGTFAIQSDCTKYQTCTFTFTGSFFKSVFTCEGNTMYNEELGRCEDPCDWYNGEFMCKKEGRFPNPGDCSAFYECIKDPSDNDKFIKIEHMCQEGYEWLPLVNAYHCVAKGTTKEKCVPKKLNTCNVPKEWCTSTEDLTTTIVPATVPPTTSTTTTTTTASTTTTTTTQATPDGFEVYNNRIVRLPKSRRTFPGSWDHCTSLGAKPFIPYTKEDFEYMVQVEKALPSRDMWVPFSDAVTEGQIKWTDGTDASSSTSLTWCNGQILAGNSKSHDCGMIYRTCPNTVQLYNCHATPFEMICEI